METFTEQELIKTKARVISNPEYTVTFITTAAESHNQLTEMEVELLPGSSTHRVPCGDRTGSKKSSGPISSTGPLAYNRLSV
jgi:hypothetical protein